MQVDLNRDFPDPIQRGAAGVVEPSGSEQPETLALMHWIRHGRFTVSASMHEARLIWRKAPRVSCCVWLSRAAAAGGSAYPACWVRVAPRLHG